jgi:asparagine synthase (glutamine-hydrolysing)
MSHERLAIVDPASGSNRCCEDGKLILAANGEIYNHRELRKQFEGKYNFQTESDCEVILALYKEKGPHLDEMNGIFGFAIYDVIKMNILLLVIIWGFHYTLVGINMELLCSFRIKST